MDYYFVDTMAQLDETFCFIRKEPNGTNRWTYKMAKGQEMGSLYPEDARVTMDRRHPGTGLCSLVGNTWNFLIVDDPFKKAIEESKTGKIEYLPLAIYDHEEKLASDKYWIVNPIGAFDCLDLERSEIARVEDEIVAIEKVELDDEKLKAAPDLFRIPGADEVRLQSAARREAPDAEGDQRLRDQGPGQRASRVSRPRTVERPS